MPDRFVDLDRATLEASPERLSRHWYDLAMLADHAVGVSALADMSLLMSVVEHKQVFFYAARAQYRDCLQGKLRLVPDEPMASELRKDFDAMREAGMFDREPPTFDTILARLEDLASRINAAAIESAMATPSALTARPTRQ